MWECKNNNDRTKKDYASVANILNAISNDKSLVIFKTIAIDGNDFHISKVNLLASNIIQEYLI